MEALEAGSRNVASWPELASVKYVASHIFTRTCGASGNQKLSICCLDHIFHWIIRPAGDVKGHISIFGPKYTALDAGTSCNCD